MHLGSSIKAYRDIGRHWSPPSCLAGDGDASRLHDVYSHWAGPGQKEPLPILRFRGRRCGQVVSVLPDILLPRCSHPAAVRDRAVAAYVTGQGTYEQVAAQVGVAKSTVFRWVAAALRRAPSWLEVVLALCRRLGLPDGPVAFRHDLRMLFRRRRVRLPGKVDGLILLEALLDWMERLRQGLLRLGHGPLPVGPHAFGHHVLDRLGPSLALTGT